MTDGATVVHAYGVVGADQPAPDVEGIGGTPVEAVHAASHLRVLVSRLPADLFGPASWDEHAEDLQWLGSVARGHQRVLEHAVAVGDVVPFRLPSIYSSAEALRSRIEADERVLESSLAAIAGRVEWGVKVYRDPSATDGEQSRWEDSTGADYLRARAGELRERADADAQLRRLVCEIHERLSRLSDDSVRNPVQDAALSGRSEQMVLNGAYLVRRDDQQRFLESVASIAADRPVHGLLVESTGPWPSYNFVGKPSLEEAAADER